MKRGLILLLAGLVATAWPATAPGQTPDARQVAVLVKRLNATKIKDSQPSIPPVAQGDFGDLKHRLPALVLTHLNTLGNPPSLETDVREAVGRDLDAVGSPFVQDSPAVQQMTPFGLMPTEEAGQAAPFTLINMVARRIPRHEDLIAVASVILVPCSWDVSLFVYRWSGREWKLLLVQQGYGYGDLQEHLDAAFVDGRAARGLFVATAFNASWCTSCWSTAQMLILRPGPDPFRPVVVKRAERSFYRCDGLRVTSSANLFKFRYSTEDRHKDAAGFVSTRIEEYVVRQGRVRQRAWTIPNSAISESTVRIVYQDATQARRARQMKARLQARGFNVVTEASAGYQDAPNTIRYIRDEDDELANWIGALVYDINYDWHLSEVQIPAADANPKPVPGTIEIWICDEVKNDQLAPRRLSTLGDGEPRDPTQTFSSARKCAARRAVKSATQAD